MAVSKDERNNGQEIANNLYEKIEADASVSRVRSGMCREW
jgi:hypothetical protein